MAPYTFERAEKESRRRPRHSRLETNLIPRMLAQHMAAGYRFQQQ